MYYLFDRIPGQHSAYTVAVLAISKSDARLYMRALWGGGTLSATVSGGQVKADCGASTEAADAAIAAQRAAE